MVKKNQKKQPTASSSKPNINVPGSESFLDKVLFIHLAKKFRSKVMIKINKRMLL